MIPTINDITTQLRKNGKAVFDFGTFHIVYRKNSKVKLRTTLSIKKVKPYRAVFFRASKRLKDEVKKLGYEKNDKEN
jgi:nucleoid DNA-binding protein